MCRVMEKLRKQIESMSEQDMDFCEGIRDGSNKRCATQQELSGL